MLFSTVWGPVLSPLTCEMISPARPTIVTETLYPFALQAAIAVCVIVIAIAAVKSFRASSCACVEIQKLVRTSRPINDEN